MMVFRTLGLRLKGASFEVRLDERRLVNSVASPPRDVQRRGFMRMSTRDLSLTAVFAALYAAMVWVFAPISFYALQFRVAGVIRPAIAKKPVLAVGYAVGVFVGNLLSPFAGIYELLFMPVMSFVAGVLGYGLGRMFGGNYFVAGVAIATVIPISVSWMLSQLFNMPILVTLPLMLVSEQVINLIGASLFKIIEMRYKWW
jgi:uncharacterized membrane protein